MNLPPVTPNGAPGLRLLLTTKQNINYNIDDSIRYEGVEVGKIEQSKLDVATDTVTYKIFINDPYQKLINTNTVFWDMSGLDIQLTSEGIVTNTTSFASLLSSRITFGLPPDTPMSSLVDNDTAFTLHASYKQAITPTYTYNIDYLIFIDTSVRGLSIGAVVEYRGIQVGKVKAINPQFLHNSDNGIQQEYPIPVVLTLSPAQVGFPDTQESVVLLENILANLVHYLDVPRVEITRVNAFKVLPVASTNIATITKKVDAILAKFEKIDITKLVTDVTSLMETLEKTVIGLQQSNSYVSDILAQANQQALAKRIAHTLDAFTQLSESYSQGSDVHKTRVQTIKSLELRLEHIQFLLHQLNQKPNSLIFSTDTQEDTQPITP